MARGAMMFEAARAMVLAALPPDLTKEQRRKQLFERIYGLPWPVRPG